MEKLRLKIWRDDYPVNPWKDWDCEPPLLFESGRNSFTDFSDGSIVRFIEDKATRGLVLRHQKALSEIMGVDVEGMETDDKVWELQDCIGRCNVEELAKLCDLFKIPNLQYTSRGYSQGDWADVLIVLTDEFFERTGANKKHSESILEETQKLFDNWCWGDVYGFTIEKAVEYVRIKKEDFESGVNDFEEELEWEQVDSCSGFFGDDFMENGMADYVPEELHEQLKNYNYEDYECN